MHVFTILLLKLLYIFLSHPLHVTISNAEINAERCEISVNHRFFADDFELLFFHLYETVIKPETGKDFNARENEMIQNYMNSAFQLIPEGEGALRMKIVSKSQQDDILWLEFRGELSDCNQVSYKLINTIMLNLYDDQTNLVIITNNGVDQGFEFDFRKREALINF